MDRVPEVSGALGSSLFLAAARVQHPEPILYIQDALDYLCRAAKIQIGDLLPDPPENPGNEWVVEAAKAISDTLRDPEEDEDEDGPDDLGLFLKTMVPT